MKVLIVDDQALNRLVLKRLLSRFPELKIFEAEDGEVAWEKLPMYDPELIFCDIFMPKVDGLSFVMRLREHVMYNQTPVIITSAGKDKEVLLKLKELGITDYLLKPYEMKSTYERLETHIRPMLLRAKSTPAEALGSTGVIPPPAPEEAPAEEAADVPAEVPASAEAAGEPAQDPSTTV